MRVATDVGGTFTDLVTFSIDADGRQVIRSAKSDTTPPNFEQGVLDVFVKAGITPAQIGFFAHGTTVVINALTERKGVTTGLITTSGFADVLEIARGNRPDFFNLAYEKPKPFVPRRLRREVGGRMNYRGIETEALDLSGLEGIVADFRAAGVRAIAVCLLHSYANPAHEIALMARLGELIPEASLVASHQITREWREYERTNTAVLSAYVQPIADAYLSGLKRAMVDGGFEGQLYVMQSNCGVDSLEATRRTPITMIESGPASGFWGAAELGRIVGEANILALDIGGTTAKCSLIENGQVKIKTDYWIERTRQSSGYPVMVPVVDLVEIGNGGGSIAWVDEFRRLHVGPQSAGAVPGPAAYGKGGTAATTTDANLALGRIDPNYFVGGALKADMGAVNAALDPLAGRLGVDRAEAARGIIRIANNNMVNALKLVSLSRGYDPRDFTLVAFGGGGAMHGVALAAELGCRKVIVPRGASVFSAWGMMMSDLRRDYFITRLIGDDVGAVPAIATLLGEGRGTAHEQFATEGIEPETLKLAGFLKCRYQNQEHSVEVPVDVLGSYDGVAHEALKARFHELYEREYTYRLTAPVEVVGLHLAAAAEVGKLQLSEAPVTGVTIDAAVKGHRQVDYATEGVHDATIYDAEKLEPGMHFIGPAIIEDPGTTMVIHPGNHVAIDRYGNTVITLKNQEARP
jgi:N-methylhydantoinase A